MALRREVRVPADGQELTARYGRLAYAARKRQIGKREIRQVPSVMEKKHPRR